MTTRGDEKCSSACDTGNNLVFDANGPIGRKLKSLFEVIETEPVPDRILDLLEQLDEAERKAMASR